MDAAQLFCAVLIIITMSLFAKSLIFPDKKPLESRRKSHQIQRIVRTQDPPKPAVPKPEMHDVEELRHLTMVELQNFNGQFGKYSDRYWREIFRRQNDAHHPDHINVSRLQTSNIITALDEHLPQGPIHDLTITGLVPKPFSSRKCEVMRYLRDRLSSSPNVELTFKGDNLRITGPASATSSG